MSDEIKLTRDEQETHINFTAQERIDGTLNVYTDDPVWINKLNKLCLEGGFKDVSDELGVRPPGKAFRSLNGEYSPSLRRKQAMSDERRAELSARMQKISAEQKQREGHGND